MNAYERSLLNAVARARLNGETGLAAHAEAKLKRVMGTARAVAALARLNGTPTPAKPVAKKAAPPPALEDDEDCDCDEDDPDCDCDEEEDEAPMKSKPKHVEAAAPKSKTYGSGPMAMTVEWGDAPEAPEGEIVLGKPTVKDQLAAAAGMPGALAASLTLKQMVELAPSYAAATKGSRR